MVFKFEKNNLRGFLMNKRKKRVIRYYKNFRKSNFDLVKKILRILSWLLPGLVIKRWMLTSAIGFLTTLLGVVIWTNLRPLYWLIEIFFSVITGLTSILPVSLMGPLIFVKPVNKPKNISVNQ